MTMVEKIATLWPEIILCGTAFVCMIIGLSPSRSVRLMTLPLAGAGIAAAALMTVYPSVPQTGTLQVAALSTTGQLFVKLAILVVGLLLLLLAGEVPNEFAGSKEDREGGDPKAFDPAHAARGEFYGFFLLSLVGAMLCAGADSLVWLFLAIELTSLPIYVLIAISRNLSIAPRAAVKYFFLGAMAAAIFLYGFALIYGATGHTEFDKITDTFREQGVGGLGLVGILLSIVGLCFKIAAVPMHFYAADVYQGAASPVTAFLAFVPKLAGFIALFIVLSAAGWPFDAPAIEWLLWILAAVTMFAGNTMALRQTNIKRVLAYSSIAHSGYMLLGLLAGPGDTSIFLRSGYAAVLFYAVTYGLANAGAFAVLGALKTAGEESETFDDLRGLSRRHPVLAATMVICLLSLTGIPPLVGFWGKAWLFGSVISHGYYLLACLALVNSAIAAAYYLHIIAVCYMEDPNDRTAAGALPWRVKGAIGAAVLVIVMSFIPGPVINSATDAINSTIQIRAHRVTQADPAPDTTATADVPSVRVED